MIELVKYSDKHIDSLLKLLNNKNVTKWLLKTPEPYTYEDADFWIKFCLDSEYEDKQYNFAIELDGELIGGIGLVRLFEHSCELGYWLGEEYWGRGYMDTVIKKILKFGFMELKLSRIFAYVFENNTRSERLLIKNRFQYEGYLKKWHIKDEQIINAKLYAKII